MPSGPTTGVLLTNDTIHNSSEFNVAGSPAVRWLAGGSAYTALEKPAGADAAAEARGSEEGTPGGTGGDTMVATTQAREIVRYDAVSGARSVLVGLDALRPPGAQGPLEIHDYSWSDDGQRLLVFTGSQKVWRQNTRGDYYVVDVSGSGAPIVQLGRKDDEVHCLMFAKFSPGAGDRVGYVYHNNIYVQELATMAVTALTSDGLPGHGGMAPVINGNFDWAYEEELSLRDGWRWSPDGARIAYWQLHTEDVQWFSLYDTTSDAPYSKVTPYPYPKVGTPNAVATVGVVSYAGGPTRWLDVAPQDGGDHYIARMEWAPSSQALLVQRIPREQKAIEMLLVDCHDEPRSPPATEADHEREENGAKAAVPSTATMATAASVSTLMVERDDAWVDVRDDGFHWIGNDGGFTWYSERPGYRHLYAGAHCGIASHRSAVCSEC